MAAKPLFASGFEKSTSEEEWQGKDEKMRGEAGTVPRGMPWRLCSARKQMKLDAGARRGFDLFAVRWEVRLKVWNEFYEPLGTY